MKLRVVVGAVIEKDDCILLGRKPENRGPYPNTWHIPGGGVNNNEMLEVALKREILEETGLEINIVERLYPYEDFTTDSHGDPIHYIFHIFLVSVAQGEITQGDDLEVLEWFPKADISLLANLNKLPPPSMRLFSTLGLLEK